MSDGGVMLELCGVSLNFRSSKNTFDQGVHHVLRDVSFALAENETLGIIGRNGVGKTTMLRIMADILSPSSGRVIIRPGVTASLLTLGLGFIPDLSGRNNAILSAMLQGATRAEAQSYLDEIKAFSELGDSFEEPVKTYSAGMRSRLGFTTALFTHVDVLLIDEILSVGDAEFREKAAAAMKARIAGEQTVVFVSHSLPQIRQLCDRVIWLDQGRIAAQGKPRDVIRQYRNSMRGPGKAASNASD